MTRRQRHGDGSVFQRKDGRWVFQMVMENGRRKPFYFKTEKEALAARRKLLYEKDQGVLATGPEQTLKVYLERWLEEVIRPTKPPNTYQTYRYNLRRHVIPALGYVKLRRLTPDMLQPLYAQMQNEGLKPKSIGVVHAALKSALENALRWGLVSQNVARLVTLPRIERYEGQVLTQAQVRKLLEVARGSRIEALLLVALTTGMRRGELLALRWSDVDFENGMLYVRRTVNRITGRGYVEGEPKSKASRRKLFLADVTVEALKKHWQYQEQLRIRVAEKWSDQGIVFSNTCGGFSEPCTVAKKLKKFLVDAGLPHMRFHDLRHSAATILLEARVDLKTVQERLGHSSMAITADIYSHVTSRMHEEAIGKIDDMFKHS